MAGMSNDLKRDIASMLNRHSRENESNTPDFILAEYLLMCLEAFEKTSNRREAWFGKSLSVNDEVEGFSKS